MTKDEQLGDNNPPGDIVPAGMTVTENITVTIGNGPADLDMSITGPAQCNPHFSNPSDAFPSNFGGIQTSQIHITAASGTLTVQYQINCPPGDFCFQVVANVAPGPGDPNLLNNQAENHLCAHVISGSTDVSVGVQKEETFNVDVSVDTTKPVVVTINNTDTAADVRVHITAISLIGQCQVRVVPHAGDTYSEYFTDEDSPTVGPDDAPIETPDTFTSQVQFTVHMAANSSLVYVYDYVIHCFQKSFHNPAFELQVDALPVAPVVEQNLGGDPITDPHNPHNNVAKNFPSVTAYDSADLQKSGCALSSPATVASGTNFTVMSTCTVKNNGPVSADFTDTTTLSLPADCTVVSGANPQTSTATLPSGGSTAISAVWIVKCTNPSDHAFTANDSVTVTTLHVKDPKQQNNSGSASSTTAITTTGDPSLSGVTIVSPASANAGQHFPVTVSGTVFGLNPPSSGTTVFALAGPSDCVETPAGSQSQAAANGAQSATWDVVCSGQSDHTFTGSGLLVPALPNHVIDSNPNNNSGTASATTAITANANLAIAITGVPAESDINSQTATLTPAVAVSNTGDPVQVTWTVVTAGSGATPCTVTQPSPNSGGPALIPPTQTNNYPFTATIPSGHECGYKITVTANATGVHEVGAATQTFSGVLQSNALVEKYVLLVGPAAVNLSDVTGRYMWVISEIGNVTDEPETVTINMAIAEPVPTGCTRTQNLILPGATQFALAAHEQKIIVNRVRYECHAPATTQVLTQTVTVGVTHCDPTTTLTPGPVTDPTPGGPCSANTINEGPGDRETFVSDNTKSAVSQVIIQ